MVRTTKSEKLTTAPIEEKKSKSKKEPVVAPTPAPAAAPTNEVVTEPVAEDSVVFKMSEYASKIQQFANLVSTLKSDFKTLEKIVAREMKAAQKASSKKKRSTGTRQPSGFVKPTLISDELAKFLGKTIGTEMARTEVSREINAYIRANSLQDKQNGRRIHPDGPLGKLLQVGKDDELTYFNLQRYMKHHFVKTTPTV
jgi:chromatin remodeling complex protein RSC6